MGPLLPDLAQLADTAITAGMGLREVAVLCAGYTPCIWAASPFWK